MNVAYGPEETKEVKPNDGFAMSHLVYEAFEELGFGDANGDRC